MTESIQPFTPEYLMSERSPRNVVQKTGTLLPIYFGDLFNGEDTQYVINYFKGPTLSFLDDAARGFLLSQSLMKGETSREELKRFKDRQELKIGHREVELPLTLSIESYGLTLLILSKMRRWPEQPRYFWGLSRTQLTVPKDNMEMLDRLDELKQFVEAAARKKITPKNLNRTGDAAQRTFAFFQVGKNLMLREPNIDEELARILRDTPLN